jgi:AcrR family transcriptional regulator
VDDEELVLSSNWAERAADRAPAIRRSRNRGVQQAKAIVEAAQRLIAMDKSGFTVQELLKEAGIALQTFYRYFDGKDQLILAVLEHMVEDACARYELAARDLPDPLSRLHFYVTSIIKSLDGQGTHVNGPRFITTEHWRLFPMYPNEVILATKPYSDLLAREIKAATDAGLLASKDSSHDAWMIDQLVLAVYHHYAFAHAEDSTEVIGDRLWTFVLGALGRQSARGQ